MNRRDRIRAEWERNPAVRRFDLYVLPVLAVLFIGGFTVAIASPRFHSVGQVTATGSLLLIIAINYGVRRRRNDR